MNKLKRAVQAEIERCKNVKILILDIAIAAAVYALGAGIFAAVDTRVYMEANDKISINEVARALETENYAELLELDLDYEREKNDKDNQEFYALIDYYEAASWYKAYLEAGDTERAAIQKEKMDAAASKIDRLSATKGRMDARLGL